MLSEDFRKKDAAGQKNLWSPIGTDALWFGGEITSRMQSTECTIFFKVDAYVV